MPPPPSVRSIYSWWSDSNSIGATIDLHAVTKPLLRLLYHRQTRNFIRENAGIPLSNANVEIFLSYLAFKYTSPKTKGMVLRHLSERATSEKDAHTLVKSNILSDLLVELLNSPDEETRNGACLIIDQLAMHNLPALEIPCNNPWQLALKEWPALVRPTSEETRAEKARSDAIDRDIFEDSKRYKKECKVLVLGTSESGKSTIIKQMKIIQGGYDERERNEYRTAIYKNVLDCVGMLARVVRRAGISSLPENVWEHAEVLLIAFPAPGGDEAHAESNEETEMESAESGSWITAMDSVDPVPFADAESNAETEMESVESGSWITAIESVDVDIDPASFMDVESNIGTEIESVESGSWITAFGSVDMVPRSDSEYHGGMLLGRVGSKRLGTSDILAQTHAVLTPALVDAVWKIWCSCTEERAADEHLAEFNLMDSSRYFFSSIHRIADPAYVPNEEDILHARTKTNSITETRFFMDNLSIHMFDVSGQHSERKKWIHCFESVTNIFFCAALSDYDQVLEEERVNRMRESLYLFESVINSRWFLRTSMVLFLTKIDVFKKKLPRIPLGRYFPEYEGGSDLQKATKYILWKYMQENRAKVAVYPHVTQPKNINIRRVFAAVKETIIQNMLVDSGILKKDMQLL